MGKPLARRPIDPESVQGVLGVEVYSVILTHREHPEILGAAAPLQELTPDMLLAAVITQRIIDVLRLDGDAPVPRKGVPGDGPA